MKLLALAELVVIAYLVWHVVRENVRDAKRTAELARLHAEERRELLNRIQRPELLPTMKGPAARVTPAKDAREMARVGAVALVPPRQPGDSDAA